MTAAFAPAPQTTFRPRSVSEVFRPVPAGPVVSTFTQVGAGPAPVPTVRRSPGAPAGRPGPDAYRRRRLGALAVVVGLVLGIASFVQGADATPTPEGELAESVTVMVQPGDTLWGIATELDPDGDPRALVSALTDLAGSTTLQPGQELVVPGHWLD